ncbi:MAG TPA: transposase family protein [Planctomycetota bacterium]|nr:transposase family protein [Planctomycetota bacterium]
MSGRLCGKLWVAWLTTALPALEQHGAITVLPTQRKQLVALSAATVDRLLRPVRQRRSRQPRRPGAALGALKAQVAVRTWSEWTGVAPGALQGDLVLHCGESTDGFYLSTLCAVDVATSWTELVAVWGVGQERVGAAVHHVAAQLPMPLRAWHSDNGSEFLNRGLVDWCRRHQIACTRGRPYRKNDQAWVEQKNGLIVRRLVGYDRFTSRAAYATLHQLYRLLRLHLNFFRPVRKLLSKHRVGAKIVKRYDAAQTPYQRLLAAGPLPPAARAALEQQFLALNPATLAAQVQRTLEQLWTLADTPRRAPAPEGQA